MNAVKMMLAMALAVTMLSGCGGASTEAVAKDVQSRIEAWPSFATARITSFTLVHKGGQQYRGLLEATKDGESVTYDVEVITDGENEWAISLGSK